MASVNEAPDTKDTQPRPVTEEDRTDSGLSASAPAKPSLFEAKSSYVDNLLSFMRGGPPVAADASPSTKSRSVPSAATGEGEGPVGLPPNFPQAYLGFCRGDTRKALALFNHGQAIRQELGLDSCLDQPYHQFETLATHYPMALHGRSKQGEYVLTHAPGKMDTAALKAAGVTKADVVKHFAYYLEFLTRQHDPEAKVLMVVDMTNLGFMKLLNGEFLATVRALSDTLGACYCRRVTRYVIVNPPGVFETLWGLVSAVLPAGARENCQLAKSGADLEHFMEAHHVPKEWGGAGERALGDADEERALRAHVAARK